MSTRCQVWVKGSDVVVYRHSDGYPDSVLDVLLPICKKFAEFRRDDPDYLSAHIVAAFIAKHKAWVNKVIRGQKKEGKTEKDLAALRYEAILGHGVEAYNGKFHGDVEWVYVVNADHVEVRTADFHNKPCTLENTHLFERVKFETISIKVMND